MMTGTAIRYVTGDATAPHGDRCIIAHVCNDIGGWGSGFVMAISARWPQPERYYRDWHASGHRFALGRVQLVPVSSGVRVANMIAQHGTVTRPGGDGLPPIRYDALRACLRTVALSALEDGSSVHMPRIGCGLAGGRWGLVEPVIREELAERGVPVTVYDLAPAGTS